MFEERLSDSDALLWTINRDPVLRNTITAVVVLDRHPDVEILTKRLDALTREVPRFRSKVVPQTLGWGRPVWREDPYFDLGLHLHRLDLPGPATLRTALDVAQVLATTAFDPELALWQAILLGGLDGGRAAFAIKLHHAMIDGVGGLAVAGRMLDTERDPTDAETRRAGVEADLERSLAARRGPLALAEERVGRLARLPWRAGEAAAGALLRPGRALADLRATAESVLRLLAPTPEPLSPLLRGRSFARRFEVIDLPVGALHRAGEAAGGTINDAFVAGILGGLRRYHELHGHVPGDLRIMMPVSIRQPSDPIQSNRFAPARFVLGTDQTDPATRIASVHQRAGFWKHAPGLELTDVLAGVLNRLPPALATSAFAMMLKGTDFVATNVAGPPVDTYLAGALVEEFYAFAPPSGSAVNVALVTMGGRTCIGVNIDPAAVPDGPVLAGCLQYGFDEVLALAADPPRAESGLDP